ncbi:pyridoxamine 5'-phosphate oxidase family protein [Paenibacillus daejeonensis]|uniref:pyridoxamine 5'-phosphate oxidase family protein n=1 Tax=Paenibacillus daejeonensis TaxID=135193 RepID=UPI00035D2A06|nr:pyridoxamine 5'-phosphate oxidase family protein [Paenibacillus daejeonensis]
MTDKQALEKKIVEVLKDNPYCSFGTVEDSRPKVRYMALFHDGLQLHLATSRKTHKVEELENNPNVFLLVGFDGKMGREVVSIEGTGSVTKDDSLREKVWSKELERWFSGPDDPDYVILDITPERIELTSKDMETQVWEQ